MRKKIGILLENRFLDKEIQYYEERFPKEGYEVIFLTRLWGQTQLTFRGMDENTEKIVSNSFETLNAKDLKEFAAIILPAGYVADFLLYEEKPKLKSPAVKFIETVMKNKLIVKGFICHSLWIASPSKDIFENRKVTCHNNIISHVENAGMRYVDATIFEDNDLITARTGGDFEPFVDKILMKLKSIA
jgi:protease I